MKNRTVNFYKKIINFNGSQAAIARETVSPPKSEFIYIQKEILDWDETKMQFSVGSSDISNLRDVLRNDLSLSLFSNKLKEAIEKAGLKGVSFHRVQIDIESPQFTPYWYAHLSYVENAFDFDNSTYKLFGDPSQVAGVTKVVLKESNIGPYDLFRIPENKPAEYVSQRFKDLFEKNKFTGVSFLKIHTT